MGAPSEAGLIGIPPHPSVQGLGEQAARLYHWIHAYEARVAALAEALDEDWVARRFGAPLADAWRTAAPGERRALLRAWHGGPAPTVAGLLQPANRLALLPTAELHVVLRTRALFARTVALRRCVDGRLLDRIAGGLGQGGAATVQGLQRHAGGALQEAGQGADLSLFARGEPEAWTLDGLRRFEHDGAWTDAALGTLIRLSLPPREPAPVPAADDPPPGTRVFLDLLPTLIPETSWLFG